MKHALPDQRRIEDRLRKRYDELWQDVRRELEKYDGQKYQQLLQGTGDPEDAATADLLVDLNLAEIDRDVDELRAVQHALARLKRGQYGICQSCGRPIDPARLEALPQAVLCVSCQARAEHERVHTPSL
ncbi:MAG TPA: TraR/DksA C4-type zinc finger protein [Gammaproteobacteria bacterium]|nr:TraR/DksA C4-type zinc finger protein [Gammaproteobacteria bacterium]